jgi:hypothetical protein
MIEGDGFLKRVVKRALPEAVRVPIRLRLADWNTGAKDELKEATRASLRDYFAADVARLETFLGEEMGWDV